jgi:hypothetical protein
LLALAFVLALALAAALQPAARAQGLPAPEPTPVPSDPTNPVDPGAGPLRSARASCTDFTIRFIDADIAQPYPQFPVGGGPILDPKTAKPGAREMTANFTCHGDGGFTLPTITTLHVMEASQGKLCHRWRSCGNLRSVAGFFGIEVGWSSFSSMGSFVVGSDFASQTVDYDGLSITMHAYVGFEQFDRFCSAPSEPACLAY